ncbi:uncharacterized protein L199_001558 [Kwoniella botswanensis]|uniref:uncharacterized protein n=1 Tax=Kwoniella botswanensis TaxID=1268659 RepID=UPI00315CD241
MVSWIMSWSQAVLADLGYISELELFAPDTLTTRKKAPLIAPEVVAGGSATEISDVFAFGKTAFQILTGVAPSKPHVWPQRGPYRCAKTLPGILDAQRLALSSKIDTLRSKSNYSNTRELNSNCTNAEPSYVTHGFFRRTPEILPRTLPAFRAVGYTSYSLVDDTVELYILAQYAGNKMVSSDPRADWLLVYEAASRRLVDNFEILRTVSACDTYVKLIFWEITHEVMWASRILTCQRLVVLQNCVSGQYLSGHRNLQLLGCVLSCQEFKSEDPKPAEFLGPLEDYPKSTAMEREESLLPKQEREILALVRGEDLMAYHEILQDAWDICSAHIIEYESGFGGSQFPSLDKQALVSTTILTEDDQEATGLMSNIPDKASAMIPIDPGFKSCTTKDQSPESPPPQARSPGETALDEGLCETDEAKQKAKAIQEMWGSLWQQQEPSTRPGTSSTAPMAWQSAVPMAWRIATAPDDTKDDAHSGVPLSCHTPSARWVN